MKAGHNSTERRRAERPARMIEGLTHRRSDPLGMTFGRVMSDPATRRRCLALKVGESITANIGEGFEVMVTRLESGELAIAMLACLTIT
jgi:hypothetical protein